jgi:hypothetical protein
MYIQVVVLYHFNQLFPDQDVRAGVKKSAGTQSRTGIRGGYLVDALVTRFLRRRGRL